MLLALANMLSMLILPLQAEAPPVYSQNYAIIIKGSIAGTESVKETTDGEGNLVSSSEHEMVITDGFEMKRLAFVTTLVLSKKRQSVLSYSYRYTSGETKDYYEIHVKNGQADRILSRAGHKFEAFVPIQPDAVILDVNVYHHYDYLVRKYDFKRGGEQSFVNFIPLSGIEVPIKLSLLGNDSYDSGHGQIPVRNLKIAFAGFGVGTFSVDKDGRLVRLLMPEQDVEVVRKDLLPAK